MIIQQKQEKDIFVCIEQWCREYQNKVIKNPKQLPLIDLSIGNPDLPPNEIWKKNCVLPFSNKICMVMLISHLKLIKN